jgi:hypothetical protein
LSISTRDQWYTVRLADIYKHGGGSVIRHYYGSKLSDALAALYPEHEWLPWRFPSVPTGIWTSMNVRNNFRDYATRQLRLSSEADWASVSAAQISALGGRGLLKYYGGSIKVAMKKELEAPAVSSHSMGTLRESLQQALSSLHSAGKINTTDILEYYSIKSSTLRRLVRPAVLEPFKSVNRAIMAAYPEHSWKPWLFQSISTYDVDDCLTLFLNWASGRLGISKMDDWYNVTYRQIMAITDDESGRSGISVASPYLRRYKNSPAAMVIAAFPQHHWNPSLFNGKSPKYDS